IKDLALQALAETVAGLGEKPYAAIQTISWLYRQRAASFEEMTNLAQKVRQRLAQTFSIGRLTLEEERRSADGSRKFLFKLNDGQKIESVLMPHKNRLTLCVSSQVGCAMGCKFCRTASMGLVRHLTQGEILEQVLAAQRALEPGQKITNIVFMGMGEPLHNYDNVISSLKILRHPKGFGFGKKQITVSTSGLAKAIEKFGEDADVKLALSLNAASDPFRDEIMPVNKRYPLERLGRACRHYNDLTRQAITMEYVMFAGLNDRPEDVKQLCRFLSNLKAKINLIPYNEYPGSPYRRPTEAAVRRFHKSLADRHFQVNIRYSKGLDILGACGQLATGPV
ncbi:MAG: 23S rRNA (adenine(2503)-C(2))-methyltransferase RlmN, partial [Deltaproteobacteria bacterium]|nr:23S rRNA (adenine(2503)-C(2))-methyltransferase RlmN [Deltaproteobacteria bacterium]